MIITSITLDNISSFAGVNTFDFNYSPSKQITIVKGNNGTGKTSLLQAIRIALYGRFLFNNNKKKYLDFISSFIRKGKEHGAITINFLMATPAGQKEYSIQRGWELQNGCPHEKIELLEDGKSYENISPEFYQEFILSIVPLGLADLFFFDGEKITELTASLQAGTIQNAVKRLLGISAMENLGDAVRRYKQKCTIAKSEATALQNALAELEKKVSTLRNEGEKVHLKYAEHTEAIQKAKRELAQKEADFYEAGGNLVSSREALLAKQELLSNEVEDKKVKIRELSQQLLPLCILSTELDELSGQVIAERKASAAGLVHDFVIQRKETLFSLLAKEQVSEYSKQTIFEAMLPDVDNSIEPIHNFSSEQTDNLLATVAKANEVVAPMAKELFSNLEVQQKELEATNFALEKGQEESAVANALSAMKELTLRISTLTATREDLEHKRKRIQEELTTQDNKKEQLYKAVEKNSSLSRAEELAKKFPDVLEKIKKAIFEQRLEDFRCNLLQNLQTLFSKEQLISKIEVSSDFTIDIFDFNENQIDVRQFSAGEKQMLASAIQWTLASIASANIPTVIDTPLARLDSKHRYNLATHYYPTLRQLIILSTDQEVDDNMVDILMPHLGSVTQLKYDTTTSSTVVAFNSTY